MSIAQQLIDVSNCKVAIKSAIIAKGVAMDSSAPFNTFASKINLITSGGSSTFHTGIGFNNDVYTIQKDASGYIYILGLFTAYNDVSANGIVRLNSNGSRDFSFNPSDRSFSSAVGTFVLDSSNHICLPRVSNPTQQPVRYNTNGTQDMTFDPSNGTDGLIYIMVGDSSGYIYIGGVFTHYRGVSCQYLARLNNNGTLDTKFDMSTGLGGGGMGTYIYAIFLDSSGHIYVGGDFTTFRGATQNNLIRLNNDGSKDTTFNLGTGFNSPINSGCLARDASGYIYVGGGFSQYQGLPNKQLVRLKDDGSKDMTFDISTYFTNSTNVLALSIDASNYIYVGGSFTTYKGLPQKYFIKLDRSGNLDPSFDVSTYLNNSFKSICLDTSNHIYLGGSFTLYKQGTTPYYISKLIRLNKNGTSDTDSATP